MQAEGKTHGSWALAWLMLGAVALFSASLKWQGDRVLSVITSVGALAFILNSVKHLRLASKPL
jgi:hypothetical protein